MFRGIFISCDYVGTYNGTLSAAEATIVFRIIVRNIVAITERVSYSGVMKLVMIIRVFFFYLSNQLKLLAVVLSWDKHDQYLLEPLVDILSYKVNIST